MRSRPNNKRNLRRAVRLAKTPVKRLRKSLANKRKQMAKVLMPSNTYRVQRELTYTQRPTLPMPMNTMSMFIRCRIDPFNSTGSQGIPDTSAIRRIVVDHKGFVDITIGAGGTAVFKTIPSPAVPLVVTSGGTSNISINGVQMAQGAAGADYTGGWIPAIVHSEWATTVALNPGSAVGTAPPVVNDPFTSARFRIVTQAFRVFYTGQANTCSGILTMTSDSLEVSNAAALVDYPLNIYVYNAGVQTTATFAASTVMTARLSINSNPQSDLPTTSMTRPESGAFMLVKHVSPDFDWQPMVHYGVVYETASNPGSSFLAKTQGGPLNSYCSLGCLDTGWESLTLSIAGAQAGATFRVEAITCVEYEPQAMSTVSRFAKLPLQTNDNVVKAVDAVTKMIPTSMPVNVNMNPWIKMAINAAAATAPVIGGVVGGPLGSAIGGLVGAIGSRF